MEEPKQIKPMEVPVRYFLDDYNPDIEDWDMRECTEDEFTAHEGRIDYTRHTVFANGVSQICLTKTVGA